MSQDRDNHPTFAYLHERLDKITARIGRLEVLMGCLIVAVGSPKIGGPTPSDLVSVVIHHVA